MPYASTKDLPDKVKGILVDEKARQIFIAAFNSAMQQYKEETKAFATAYSALQRAGYHRNKDGKFSKGAVVAEAHKGKRKDCQICPPLEIELHKCQHLHKVDVTTHDDSGETRRLVCADCKAELSEEQDITLKFDIAKTDTPQRLVFGWASVIEENGQAVVDKQGDVISVEDLEKSAYDFNLNVRDAGEMHERVGVGKLVESMVFTKEKQEALGIDLKKVAWWVGWKLDPDVFERVVSGELRSMSIGGKGKRFDTA